MTPPGLLIDLWDDSLSVSTPSPNSWDSDLPNARQHEKSGVDRWNQFAKDSQSNLDTTGYLSDWPPKKAVANKIEKAIVKSPPVKKYTITYPSKIENPGRVTKLDGTNYREWYETLRFQLESQGVWAVAKSKHLFHGPIEDQFDLKHCVLAIKAFILLTVDDRIGHEFRNFLDSSIPSQWLEWTEECFCRDNPAVFLSLASRYIGCHRKNFRTLVEYGNEMERLVHAMHGWRPNMFSKEAQLLNFINGIAKEWRPWALSYTQRLKQKMIQNPQYQFPSVSQAMSDAQNSSLAPKSEADAANLRFRDMTNPNRCLTTPNNRKVKCTYCFSDRHTIVCCEYKNPEKASSYWKRRYPSQKMQKEVLASLRIIRGPRGPNSSGGIYTVAPSGNEKFPKNHVVEESSVIEDRAEESTKAKSTKANSPITKSPVEDRATELFTEDLLIW